MSVLESRGFIVGMGHELRGILALGAPGGLNPPIPETPFGVFRP